MYDGRIGRARLVCCVLAMHKDCRENACDMRKILYNASRQCAAIAQSGPAVECLGAASADDFLTRAFALHIHCQPQHKKMCNDAASNCSAEPHL